MSIGAARSILHRAGARPLKSVLGTLPPGYRTFFSLMRSALISTVRDGCIGYSKGAAYSALLSFFPLMATAATILVHTRANYVSDVITTFLHEVLPPGTESLVFNYFTVHGARPVLLPITAIVVSILGASGGIVSLMEGFQRAYRIPVRRPFFPERIIAILLVFSAAIPVAVASVLLVLGARAEEWAIIGLGLLPKGAQFADWVLVLGAIARYLIALGSIILGATILYYVGPNRPQRLALIWPGAVLTTTLWLGATLVFAWYVRHLGHYNVMYGGIAAVILLLVWMYLLAIIALIGCEFNSEYEKAVSAAVMRDQPSAVGG